MPVYDAYSPSKTRTSTPCTTTPQICLPRNLFARNSPALRRGHSEQIQTPRDPPDVTASAFLSMSASPATTQGITSRSSAPMPLDDERLRRITQSRLSITPAGASRWLRPDRVKGQMAKRGERGESGQRCQTKRHFPEVLEF